MSRPSAPFQMPIQRQAPKVGPAFNPWYWNPNELSIQFAPEWFRKPLKREMGDELEITWNPINERWQVWSRSPRINHPICQGWRLLFIHNGPNGDKQQSPALTNRSEEHTSE